MCSSTERYRYLLMYCVSFRIKNKFLGVSFFMLLEISTFSSGKLSLRSLFSTTSHVRCVLETKFKAICAFSSVSPDTLIGKFQKQTFTK